MSVIFLTRFSIPVPEEGRRPFVAARNKKYKDYLNILFSYERLQRKMSIFEKLSIPSFVAQTSKDFKWYIITSHKLPSNFLNKLENLLKPHSFIKLHFVDNLGEFYKLSDSLLSKIKENYISCRIDDDDGIEKTFVEKMLKYVSLPQKHVISFPSTIQTTYDVESKQIIFHPGEVKKKNHSVGLGTVNYNIYRCGNHTKIHENYSVVYDNTPGMVFQTCDEFCDTKRKVST